MTRREAKGLLSSVKDRIHDIKKFAVHAAAYLTVNMFLLILNVIEGPDGPVVIIPIILWGIVLGMHWNRVFGRKGKKTRQWEEAMLHEFMYGEEMPEPEEQEKVLLVREYEKKILALSKSKDTEAGTLQKRIENLEAIITSHKWERIEERLDDFELKNLPKEELAE